MAMSEEEKILIVGTPAKGVLMTSSETLRYLIIGFLSIGSLSLGLKFMLDGEDLFDGLIIVFLIGLIGLLAIIYDFFSKKTLFKRLEYVVTNKRVVFNYKNGAPISYYFKDLRNVQFESNFDGRGYIVLIDNNDPISFWGVRGGVSLMQNNVVMENLSNYEDVKNVIELQLKKNLE